MVFRVGIIPKNLPNVAGGTLEAYGEALEKLMNGQAEYYQKSAKRAYHEVVVFVHDHGGKVTVTVAVSVSNSNAHCTLLKRGRKKLGEKKTIFYTMIFEKVGKIGKKKVRQFVNHFCMAHITTIHKVLCNSRTRMNDSLSYA